MNPPKKFALIGAAGFGLDEARTSINTVYEIRNAEPSGLTGDFHPFCSKVKR